MPGSFAFPAPNPYRSIFRKADGSYDWEKEMDFGWSMIDQQSVGSLAAFVFEPILSVGGILEPPEGYIARMAAECRRRGMLVIADEAQTGLGRTGDMFAFQREGIVPDILALSKTVGCGLPVASVSTTPEIEARALKAGFLWITTHLNDPLAAAVASKAVEIVVRDNLCQQARDRGQQLREGLLRLQEKYWCIGDVRGRGLMQGLEIISDPVTKAPGTDEVKAVCKASLEGGLSFQIVALPGSCAVFRLAPPITITVEEIDEALAILGRAFATVFPAHDAVEASTPVVAEARL
jgi:4-aminobutyrate aminotransferase-like enzyme